MLALERAERERVVEPASGARASGEVHRVERIWIEGRDGKFM